MYITNISFLKQTRKKQLLETSENSQRGNVKANYLPISDNFNLIQSFHDYKMNAKYLQLVWHSAVWIVVQLGPN